MAVTPRHEPHVMHAAATCYPHKGELRMRAWLFSNRAKRIGTLIVLTFVLAGCSWFGGRTAQQNDRSEPNQIDVELGDFFFEPEEVVGKVGQEITLHLRNTGATIHNWRVDEFNVDQDVDVGRSETITFTPNQAGTFRVICDIPGHVEAGMVGTLRIEP